MSQMNLKKFSTIILSLTIIHCRSLHLKTIYNFDIQIEKNVHIKITHSQFRGEISSMHFAELDVYVYQKSILTNIIFY